MTKRAKTILLISIVYSLLFAGLLVNALYLISAEGAKLDVTKNKISENTAKEIAYTKMMTLLESSKDKRDTLKEFFVTEDETISFLSSLETAAKKIGVKLETNELEVIPSVTKETVVSPAALSVSFTFNGSEREVKKFLEVLENIPYHTIIPKVTLTGNPSDGLWSGSAKLLLTLQS